MTVGIVGAGASGVVAAILLARKNHHVILLEKNNDILKKILITGNGRCNYWNEDQENIHYHSTNKEILNLILTDERKRDVLNFFDSIGMIPKIKDGYYYPVSNQAVSMKSVLYNELKNLNVEIKQINVEDIQKFSEQFIINPKKEHIVVDKLILSTGSKAAPKTGSDGSGYALAKIFNHTIIKPLPSLVQLKANESYFSLWDGIRTDVSITLYENNQKIKTEVGEIQLTKYGVSGICVLNLSHYVAKGLEQKNKEKLNINFLPFLNLNSKEELLNFINKRNQKLKNRTVDQLFDGLVNYKLMNTIFKILEIDKNKNWMQLDQKEKLKLCEYLYSFPLEIISTNSFIEAQVCSGGVPLNEINPNTMESLKTKNLYIIGELLDVNGDCGGYNLSFAWISAIIAGTKIGDL